MRPEENPLDLNNLPEDFYTRDGKQPSEDSSSSAVIAGGGGGGGGGGGAVQRRRRSSGRDESGKVYECRFCSLKFCKSQALGGHMNRHRQERETETLNKARQLVFTNDLAPGHLGYVSSSGYHHHHQAGGNMPIGESPLPLRPLYTTTRLFPTTSPLIPPPAQPPQPQAAPYMYPSPPRLLPFSGIPYPSASAPPVVNDYFVGHVLSNSSYDGNYTYIGAPVGQGFLNGGGSGGGSSRNGSEEEGLVGWSRR